MPNIGPFENYPDRYEEWFERNRFAYLSELEAVKRLLPKGRGVEIGVGSGRFSQPLGIKLGVEPSRKMAELARKKGIEVVKGTAEDLPFRDGEFDFALMVTTICFLDDVETAFREVYRILKPGGSVIIGFIDKNGPIGKLYQDRKKENVFYMMTTFYSVGELLSLLEKSGFKDFSLMQTIFQGPGEIDDIEPVKKGYGEGSFVVIKGLKPLDGKKLRCAGKWGVDET